MSDVGSASGASYSTGGGSSAAGDTDNAAALAALEERGCAGLPSNQASSSAVVASRSRGIRMQVLRTKLRPSRPPLALNAVAWMTLRMTSSTLARASRKG
jgi:hypothetical protein